jgi:hypothetical protein
LARKGTIVARGAEFLATEVGFETWPPCSLASITHEGANAVACLSAGASGLLGDERFAGTYRRAITPQSRPSGSGLKSVVDASRVSPLLSLVVVATGAFGARMSVEIVNDGPVTIVLKV